MLPTKETKHIGTGLALLIEQFKGKVVLPKFLTLFLDQMQDLENVTWDVIDKRLLGVATGDQLDMLGDLVGEARAGRNDTDYRAAVSLRIRVNRSQGRAEDIIQISNLASNNTAKYYEYSNASFAVEIFNATSPLVVARMLYQAKATGTGGALVYTNWATTNDVFTWDNSTSPVAGRVWDNALGAPTERWSAAVALTPNAPQVINVYSPLQLPQLELWLDANVGVTLEGGPGTACALWSDQSGKNRHFQHSGVGNGPFLNTTGMNGFPGLEWTGLTTDNLFFNGTWPNLPIAEIWIVKKNTAVQSQGLWILSNVGAPGDLHPDVADFHIKDSFGSTTRKDVGVPPTAQNVGHIYGARSAPALWQADHNGTQFFTVASNAVGWPSFAQLGINTGVQGSKVIISEVLIFSRFLNADERLALKNYLIAKWNIDLSPPATPPTVSAITPNVGFKTGAGLPVTITGTNFVNGAVVSIGGVACTSVVWVNSTTITCVTGNVSTEGQKSVIVTNPDTQQNGANTLYLALQAFLWIRANTGDYSLDGGGVRVGTINDLSGSGNTLVSQGTGTGPTWISSSMNSLPAFRFSTGGDWMQKVGFSGPSSAEIMVIKKSNSAAQQGFWTVGSSAVQDWNPFGSAEIYDSWGSTTRKNTGIPPGFVLATYSSAHFWGATTAAGAYTARMNGSQYYTNATNTVGWNANFIVGKNAIGTALLGDIGEMVCFGRVLNTTERGIAETYLKGKWGIP